MRDGEFSLPAAYSEIRASNIASIKNTLEQFRKYDLYDYALKKIQIDERVLKANTNISILAGTDLFDFAKDFFTEKEYSDIANRNATVAFDNFLKKEINASQSGIKIAKEIINLASNVEQNWDYRFIHSDLKSIIIETNESDLMRSGRSYRSYTNNITTFIRFTFIKSALKHFNVKNVQINPISDWNNHDKKFRFSINIQ